MKQVPVIKTPKSFDLTNNLMMHVSYCYFVKEKQFLDI
jgi:hypothetical protein